MLRWVEDFDRQLTAYGLRRTRASVRQCRRALLLMDNLASHRSEEVLAALTAIGVRVVFFPVRSSCVTSPVDSSLVACFKRLFAALPAAARGTVEAKFAAADGVLQTIDGASVRC